LVGFSGGSDSVALMGVMATLQRAGVVQAQGLHVDHGVRPSSSIEAEAVAATGAKLGIEVTVRAIAPERLQSHLGVGREEAMRRERYLAFASVAASVQTDLVALAHHQQDQAETVLLHLLRGAGLRGASGMREVVDLPVPWWDQYPADTRLRIWRPFLSEPVKSLQAYATSLGVPIVDDASNGDTTFRRNAIRHEVMPVLERVSPGAAVTLARFADLIADDDALLDSLAYQVLQNLADPRVLERHAVLAAPAGLRRRVVWLWLRDLLPSGMELALNRVDEVVRAVEVRGPIREVQIADGVSVMVSRDGAVVVGR
jgi:tRNA(Ile)-lysidine synthase